MSHPANLLPKNFRRTEVLRRRARQWGAWWALATVVAVAVASAWFLAHDEAVRAQLQAEQRQNDRLAKSEKKLAVARAKLSVLHEQEAVLANLGDGRPSLLVLGTVSRCARRTPGAIHVEGLSLSKMDSTSGTQTPSTAPPRKDQGALLTLKGTATDGLAVASFTTALRDAGVFTAVERKSSGTTEADETRPVSYLIECRY